MTMTADAKLRPAADADHREASQYRRRGIALALVGFLIAAIAFIGNLWPSDSPAMAKPPPWRGHSG